MDFVPDIGVCSGPCGISWDGTCEPVDFCLHVIDSEVIAKMQGQTNLYARKKVGKLRRAQNNLSHSSRFRQWTSVTISGTRFTSFTSALLNSQRPHRRPLE